MDATNAGELSLRNPHTIIGWRESHADGTDVRVCPTQLHFVDSVQRRYEVIRPIVLLGDRTVAQRAEETQLHPETVRDFTRRFRHQGMLGLLPAQTEIVIPRRGQVVPEAVVGNWRA